MSTYEENIYDEGWIAGYKDIQPYCPYSEDSNEYKIWWEGYSDGSRNS